MEAELSIQPKRTIKLSSFERFEDGSGSACLELISGRFTYHTDQFFFDEFPTFVNNLERMYRELSGTAELRFHHESEFLIFESKSLGHIEVTGEFVEYGDIQQTLCIGFEFDQSYLPGFIEQLRGVQHALYS